MSVMRESSTGTLARRGGGCLRGQLEKTKKKRRSLRESHERALNKWVPAYDSSAEAENIYGTARYAFEAPLF
jgi:hypothetical protein